MGFMSVLVLGALALVFFVALLAALAVTLVGVGFLIAYRVKRRRGFKITAAILIPIGGTVLLLLGAIAWLVCRPA